MGKILGISDLPSTTVVSTFGQSLLPEPAINYIGKPNFAQEPDVVILKNQPAKVLNPKLRSVNRWMKHFSKPMIH